MHIKQYLKETIKLTLNNKLTAQRGIHVPGPLHNNTSGLPFHKMGKA